MWKPLCTIGSITEDDKRMLEAIRSHVKGDGNSRSRVRLAELVRALAACVGVGGESRG